MPLRMPRGRAADTALACVTGLAAALGSVRSLFPQHRLEPWGVTTAGWVLIAAACGALYFRRRRPVAAAAVCAAATAAYYLISSYDGPLMIAPVAALYAVAAAGRIRAAIALAALIVIGVGAGTLAGNEEINGIALFMLTGWLVGMVALGSMQHGRRAYAEEEARLRAAEERLRIAREVHDVVGHNISMINVQAGAALHRLKKTAPPDDIATAALEEIKAASKETLRELRATLGVLRQVDEAAPTAPPPGADRLPELADGARRAGLDVHLTTHGEPRPLPAEVDLAVYRIVQESLTNVTRHARDATAVGIELIYARHQLTVTVVDDGHGGATSSADGTGSGLNGLRERARLLGGRFHAGPLQGGGFSTEANLPYENRESRVP
ncbi:sensor histidine kinase [Streptomyces sp. NPDC087218]|uniref:sensor histidine kinase n=1 Tax=Streptomyces sp. NPDC087218 TaxID=3365769 RepID=UPI0038148B50